MIPVLRVLEHLSYVIECAAMEYRGEAKYELGCLCTKIETDPLFDVSDASDAIQELHIAQEAFMREDPRAGASALARASRALWRAAAALDSRLQSASAPSDQI